MIQLEFNLFIEEEKREDKGVGDDGERGKEKEDKQLPKTADTYVEAELQQSVEQYYHNFAYQGFGAMNDKLPF